MKPLLVRIYGETEGLLDRESENRVFEVLSKSGISPELYGTYSWGRLEDFILDHFHLESGEAAICMDGTVDMVSLLGQSLRRLHAVSLPDTVIPCVSTDIFSVLRKWLCLASKYADSICTVPLRDSPNLTPPLRISIDGLSREVKYVRNAWETCVQNNTAIASSPICSRLLTKVLCHNDLLSGNLMFNPSSKSLRLIDFEYAGLNFEAADLANVLTAVSESIMLSGRPQEVRINFPSADIQIHLVESCTGMSVPEEERGIVLLLLLFFSMTDELRWTVWGVIQSVQSTLEGFDYVFYYNSRFNAYMDYKRMFEDRLETKTSN